MAKVIYLKTWKFHRKLANAGKKLDEHDHKLSTNQFGEEVNQFGQTFDQYMDELMESDWWKDPFNNGGYK